MCRTTMGARCQDGSTQEGDLHEQGPHGCANTAHDAVAHGDSQHLPSSTPHRTIRRKAFQGGATDARCRGRPKQQKSEASRGACKQQCSSGGLGITTPISQNKELGGPPTQTDTTGERTQSTNSGEQQPRQRWHTTRGRHGSESQEPKATHDGGDGDSKQSLQRQRAGTICLPAGFVPGWEQHNGDAPSLPIQQIPGHQAHPGTAGEPRRIQRAEQDGDLVASTDRNRVVGLPGVECGFCIATCQL